MAQDLSVQFNPFYLSTSTVSIFIRHFVIVTYPININLLKKKKT